MLRHLLNSTSKLFFLIPGDGNNLIQPLWVEDLATCMTWALDDPDTENQTYEIGGPEFLTMHEVIRNVMDVIGIRRSIMTVSAPDLIIYGEGTGGENSGEPLFDVGINGFGCFVIGQWLIMLFLVLDKIV